MQTLEHYGWVTPTKFNARTRVPTCWAVNPRVHDGRFQKVTDDERARREAAKAAIEEEAEKRRRRREAEEGTGR